MKKSNYETSIERAIDFDERERQREVALQNKFLKDKEAIRSERREKNRTLRALRQNKEERRLDSEYQ